MKKAGVGGGEYGISNDACLMVFARQGARALHQAVEVWLQRWAPMVDLREYIGFHKPGNSLLVGMHGSLCALETQKNFISQTRL